jgi:enhancer of yellow 2 transcription factor
MADSKRESEQDYKNRLNEKLQNSGEIEKLKQTLRDRLQTCGWTDQMKTICKGSFKTPKLFFVF